MVDDVDSRDSRGSTTTTTGAEEEEEEEEEEGAGSSLSALFRLVPTMFATEAAYLSLRLPS
jgi:hypothetical protein